MNFIRNIQKNFEIIGGIKNHLRHPLDCRWQGHNIDIRYHNKKSLLLGAFHAAIPALVGILALSAKRLTYRKVTVIGLTLISSATFGISYILQTLAWKVSAINGLKKNEMYKKIDQQEFEMTPLQKACAEDDADLAMKLLEEGVDPSVCREYGINVLQVIAARKDDAKFLPIIDKILEKHPKLLNQVDSRGFTPLHYAARNFFPSVVQKLLSLGADVNIVSKEGLTPLDALCEKIADTSDSKAAAVIELLLDKGAHFSKYKQGPLDMNLESLHKTEFLKEESLLSLYKLGLFRPVKDKCGKMMIYYACSKGYPKLVKWLVEEGKMAPHLFNSGSESHSPFESLTGSCALYEGRQEVIFYLLDKNLIPVEKREKLFCQACLVGYHKVVEKLKDEFKIDVKREFVNPHNEKVVSYPFVRVMRIIDCQANMPLVWDLYEENFKKTAKLLKPSDESLITDSIKALALKHGI